MKNWSGHLSWNPSEVFYPTTEEDIQKIVCTANEKQCKIRIIGSGHSFTPLFTTSDFLVSLDKYQGLVSIDRETNEVTVKAGTKLSLLNDLLDKEALALANMGDINVQSLAGALSTGTHGTGTAFGNMSTFITKIVFINGEGNRVECSEKIQPEIFKAAQVSLGVLGIITEITLQCVPAFCLELNISKEQVHDLVQNVTQLNAENRNFEFFWFPNTAYCLVKKIVKSEQSPGKQSMVSYINDTVIENYAFKLLCEMSYRFPKMSHRLSNFAMSTIDDYKKIRQSHQIFSSPRTIKFNEMEYNIPIEAYPDVKKDIVKWVNQHNQNIVFPIENRFVKKDDIYLSPAYERDSAYIAVHAYHKKDFTPFFTAMEDIFKAYNGRPHWGKMHTMTAENFEAIYPMFTTFNMVRNQQDPGDIFLTPYMSSILQTSQSKV